MIESFVNKLGNEGIKINGPPERHRRLPNTLNISFKGIKSSELINSLGHLVAVSAGSA